MYDHLTIPFLKKLAAFDDKGANDHLRLHKSFSRFDEPNAVAGARSLLVTIEQLRPHLIDEKNDVVRERLDFIEKSVEKFEGILPSVLGFVKELTNHIRASMEKPPGFVPKLSLDLAEEENSNLRKLLMRAAAFMPEKARQEIARDIRKPFKEGGAVTTAQDDLGMEIKEALKLLKKMTDHVQKIIDGPLPSDSWWTIASNLCSKAREHEHLAPEPKTIHGTFKES